MQAESLQTTLVSNGRVDIRGRIADKITTGGWKAAPFIIGLQTLIRRGLFDLEDPFPISCKFLWVVANEVAERLAFFSIAVNMVSYLVFEMHQSIPKAATHVTDWIGAAYVLTILGAFLADAYLGRFRTIVLFSSIYVVVSITHNQ